MPRVYMDHAATTPLFPEVVELMTEFLKNHYGNPSSLHSYGLDAKNHLDKAREQVAALINAEAANITFTSGGTEADNLAILGMARKKGKGHLITSAVEHHAVLDTFKYLSKQGFDLTILPVDEYGMVSADDLKNALRDDTILVSIMHANNEVG
ncbi:MAG: aminotransferase class V-fold PLP-dependent enzyme, partial [Clostridiales bacterium]